MYNNCLPYFCTIYYLLNIYIFCVNTIPIHFLFVDDTYKIQVITKKTKGKNTTHSFHQRCSMMSEKKEPMLGHNEEFANETLEIKRSVFQKNDKIEQKLSKKPCFLKVFLNMSEFLVKSNGMYESHSLVYLDSRRVHRGVTDNMFAGIL